MSVSSIPAKLKHSEATGEEEQGQDGSSSSSSRTWLSRQVTKNLDDFRSVELWQACFAEFVGVALLAFFTIGVGISKEGEEPTPLLQGALGTAFFISIIITSLTTVSGGHVNPAVSIGFLLTNQITLVRFLFYSVSQVLGSVTGTALLEAMLPEAYRGTMGVIRIGDGVPQEQALAMEIAITFLLLFAIMAFIDSHREDVQGSVPYMVGLTVCVNILTAAKVSGGCMNPARALGPAIVTGDMEYQWIYWVGPMVGGALGALLYDKVLSTRPLPVIAKAIDKTKPSTRRRRRLSSRIETDSELLETTEHSKLNS